MMINFSKNTDPINTFTIYGERHSGTNLLESLIETKTNLRCIWTYGWKHFFGFTNYKKLIQANNTLFVGIVRNPYDWIMSMYKKPYHVPTKNKQDIHSFLFNDWYSEEDFYPRERPDDKHYIVHRRYNNIFEMRKLKLEYLYKQMPVIVPHYCLTTYEYITDNAETFIDTLCRFNDIEINSSPPPKIHKRNTYNISTEIKQIIDNNLHWDTEKYFGYTKQFDSSNGS